MGKQQSDLDKLYNAVSAQFDIGDIDSFRNKMKTTDDRKRFYDAVSENGFDLGDYSEYESRLGKQAEVSVPGSTDTSIESVEPMQNTGQLEPSIQSQSVDSSEPSLVVGPDGRHQLWKKRSDNEPYEPSPMMPSKSIEVSVSDFNKAIPRQMGGSDSVIPNITPEITNPNQIGKRFAGGMQLMGTEINPNDIHAAEDFKRAKDGMQRVIVDIPYDDHTLGIEKQVEFEIPANAQVVAPRLSDTDGQYMMQYIDAEGNRVNAMEILTLKPTHLQSRKRQLENKPFEEWTPDDRLEYFGAKVEEVTGKLTEEEKQNRRITADAEADRMVDQGFIGAAIDMAGAGIRAFGSGSTRLGADILGIPEYLNDAIASVMGTRTFQETYGETFLDDMRKYMRGAISRDDLYNNVRYDGSEVIESFKKGNIEDGIAKLVMGTTNSLPIMLSLSSGNVMGLTSTLSMGAGQYDQLMEENKGMDQNMKLLNATLNMYAEMVPEKIGAEATFKPFYDLFKSQGKEVAESALRKYMTKFAGQFGVLTPAGVEGATEGTTAFLQNIIAKYSGEDPNRKLSQGVADAMLVGAVAGQAISSPANVANFINDRFQRNDVEKLMTENEYFEGAMDADGISDGERSAMIEKYFSNVNKINSYIEEKLDRVGSLGSKDKNIVEALEARKSRMNEIINNPNTPESVKASTQSDVDVIDGQIEEVLKTTQEAKVPKGVDAIDKSVESQRNATPDLANAPMGELEMLESTESTLSRIESKEAVEDDEISKATTNLNQKKKELTELLNDPNRVHTSDEINSVIEGIDSDLDMLSRYNIKSISNKDFYMAKPGDVFSEGEVKSASIDSNGEVEIVMTDGTILNSKDYEKTKSNVESSKKDTEVPVEGIEVAPVGETAAPTQEVVESERTLKETFNDLYSRFRNANLLDDGFALFPQGMKDVISKGLSGKFFAHGMGKSGLGSSINDLFKLFNDGVDPNRGPGYLYTAPLEGSGEASSGIGAGSAYSNGAFILVSDNPQISDINQVQGILVNDGIIDEAPQVIEQLKKRFPNLEISTFSEAGVVAENISKKSTNDTLDKNTDKSADKKEVESKNKLESTDKNESITKSKEAPIETESKNKDVAAEPQEVDFSTEQEAARKEAETTTDPDTIVRLYKENPPAERDYIPNAISEYLGDSKVNARDYIRYGDQNNLLGNDALVKNRIDKENSSNVSLESMAEEISERYNVEVTPDDIIEHIDKYASREDFIEASKSDLEKTLESRYKELTGRRLTPNVVERYDKRQEKKKTDADLIKNDPNMQELGVTPEQVASQAEMEANEGFSPVEAPLPKSLVKGISDRLKLTGLARSVKVTNSDAISQDVGVDGATVNGYVDSKGNIVINGDTAGVDTPIHEFGHVWETTVERDNPELHARGMDLIKSDEGQAYVDHVKKTQPGLKGDAIYKEALAQAIGDSGARIINSQQRGKITEWLKAVWDYVGGLVGISGKTADEISNMSLREFTDSVAVDLLSGNKFAKLDNGDILIESSPESKLDAADKFINDFIEKMKKRNGVSFQGTVDGSLSTEDFMDLITFYRHAKNKGLINGVEDARKLAATMGINSPAQVDAAYELSKLQEKESTGFKKGEASVEAVMGANFTKMSDAEYREAGKRLVDEGLVNPEKLVEDIITDPRALQPWEVAALQYYRSQIDSQMSDALALVESNDQAAVDSFSFKMGDTVLTGYKAIAAKTEMLNARLFDLEVSMLSTAHQQSAAFRMRSLMSDKDFNVVQYLAEMKARGYVDPKLEQKLKDLSGKLNEVRAKLRRKEAQVERMTEQIALGNIKQEASQTTRRSRPRKSVVNAVNIALDSLDLSSFGNPTTRFQANGTVRFQTSPNNALSDAVANAVSEMKSNIADGSLSVAEAIEQAVSSIDAVVGEDSWNSMKFRSDIANQLVSQSVPVKIKKPYVNSDGVLVIPGEYIKDMARNGMDTIDKMVAQANKDLGGSFSDYDIQNAISGYGRQAASNKNDLDRKVSKAKLIAKLLSQIEDLEKKGSRLKTSKQVHDNDARINSLKEEIKQREYNLEMTPEERAQLAEQRYNESRRKYLKNYMDLLEKRISNRDFAPQKHKNKYEDDGETEALRVEAESLKNEFKKEKYRHELETRTAEEKWRALTYDAVFNITRGLSAGADASAIGVQGAIFSAARPAQAYKILAASKKGTFSEVEYEAYFARLQADPLYEVARKSGLNLQLPSFYKSVQEEQYKGELPEMLVNEAVVNPIATLIAKATGKDAEAAREFGRDKVNPFTLGDRNYSLVLSQMRMDLFREFITNQQNKQGLDIELDTKTVEQVAEMVNTITMASKVPALQNKAANDIASAIFFSVRKFVATWKVLGAWAPLLVGPNRNYQLFKDAYGGIIGRGLGTMMLTAAIPTAFAYLNYDEEDEEKPYFYNENFLNPKHSDFMKLKFGDTRISFFQGIDGNVVFATRMITGDYMTSSSKAVKPLNGEGFNKDRFQLGWDYISNKFAPTTSTIHNMLKGDRERQEAYDRYRESFMPMWISGIKDQYEKTGNVLETGGLAVLGIFGLSYNNYGGAEFANSKGSGNKKAQEIFDKSGLSAYDPAPNQRSYWDGKERVKLGGKVFKDKYLPAYQKFMTEGTLSKANKLAPNVNWEIKEGVVDAMKREAYKYAEIKTSGILSNDSFSKFSADGTGYRLLKSQYPIKVGYVEEYMKSRANRDKRNATREVEVKLKKDGVKATKEYVDMLVDINIYNRANKYANEQLIKDLKRRKIKLIKQAEYNSDMENPD